MLACRTLHPWPDRVKALFQQRVFPFKPGRQLGQPVGAGQTAAHPGNGPTGEIKIPIGFQPVLAAKMLKKPRLPRRDHGGVMIQHPMDAPIQGVIGVEPGKEVIPDDIQRNAAHTTLRLGRLLSEGQRYLMMIDQSVHSAVKPDPLDKSVISRGRHGALDAIGDQVTQHENVAAVTCKPGVSKEVQELT